MNADKPFCFESAFICAFGSSIIGRLLRHLGHGHILELDDPAPEPPEYAAAVKALVGAELSAKEVLPQDIPSPSFQPFCAPVSHPSARFRRAVS